MIVFRSHIRPLNTKGFTLLEVMVSIAILAIVLVSIFKLQSGTYKLAELGNFNRVAPLLARQQLAILESGSLDSDDLSGDFGEDFKGYEWFCTIENTDFEELETLSDQQLEKLRKITIKITALGKSYRLSTWRYIVGKEDR
ncbi:MAG: prepilin-type N-terminal cleavage/methylation domain-containing protein [Desulfobacteraceae bacterium]|nr:prepilin-type N-terminal cleavage/methylation domain-containing protein [Desulfobacteraceae bacterium]